MAHILTLYFAGSSAEIQHLPPSVVCDKDRGALEALSSDGRSLAVILDVTDFGAISVTIPTLKEQIRAIDVLINSAGYGHEGISRQLQCSPCTRVASSYPHG